MRFPISSSGGTKLPAVAAADELLPLTCMAFPAEEQKSGHGIPQSLSSTKGRSCPSTKRWRPETRRCWEWDWFVRGSIRVRRTGKTHIRTDIETVQNEDQPFLAPIPSCQGSSCAPSTKLRLLQLCTHQISNLLFLHTFAINLFQTDPWLFLSFSFIHPYRNTITE